MMNAALFAQFAEQHHVGYPLDIGGTNMFAEDVLAS